MGEYDHLSFRLSEEFIDQYRSQPVQWGFDCGAGNTLGELTWLTKYSRVKDDGTKEQWYEGCRRVIEGVFSILKDHCLRNRTPWNHAKAQRAAEDAYDRMFHFKWTPPGRGLWMMGTKFVWEEGSAALQNCAFLSTQHLGVRNPVQPFIRLMEMSMLGIGVGFDTLGAGKLTIHQPEGDADEFQIPDSREGWCESLERQLRSYFTPGKRPVTFDYSLVRPAGEPIKRFGGVAAGPGPLKKLHEGIARIFEGREGQEITSSDIVDVMNMIGKCVVAGNVRRSAEIAFGLPDDKEFLQLKDPTVNPERMGPDGWGYLSNNSIMAEVGGNYDNLVDQIAVNGEPGLNYLDLARSHGRLIDPPNHKDHRAMGANPCVTADTWVMTTEGPKRAIDLLDTPFWAVVDGKAYRSRTGMFKTRTAEVYRLTTSHGYELKLTDNHEVKTASGEMVAARDLAPGDLIQVNNHRALGMWPGRGSEGEGYLLGSFVGDGGWESGTAVVKLWEKDQGSGPIADCILDAVSQLEKRADWSGWRSYDRRGYRVLTLPKRWITEWLDVGSKEGDFESTSYEFHTGFLRGLFDADASVQGYDNDKGLAISLTQASYERLQMVQRMLLRLGVLSYLRQGRPEGVRDFGKDRGGEYQCQETWRLMISGGSVREFMLHVGFDNEVKRSKVEKAIARMTRGFYSEHFWVKVKSLEYVSTEDVYDCTVDDVHLFDANGIVVSNCAEQTLEDGELCTLVETYPIKHEDLDDFKKTLKWAYLYGKAVTLLPTHWPDSNEVMQRNRRIGCSVSGIVQFAERHGWTELRRWMDEGYQAVADRDRQYSEWLGVRESIKMTSVKPSGTVSILAGVTPGVHWPEQDVYLRRMRFRVNDPMVDVFQQAGYHVEPDVMDPDHSVVVTFPTRGPDVRTNREVSVWEKVSLAALLQKYWADNQVSATFTFRQDEKDQIGPLLRSFDGQLKSMSFLPMLEEGGAYAQMPYERIDIEEWEKATANVERMDLMEVYLNGADPEGERYCTTDICLI